MNVPVSAWSGAFGTSFGTAWELPSNGITLDRVGRAICGGDEIIGIYCGEIFVWPDPWTDIWDEGNALVWTNVWRDKWSDISGPPVGDEVAV